MYWFCPTRLFNLISFLTFLIWSFQTSDLGQTPNTFMIERKKSSKELSLYFQQCLWSYIQRNLRIIYKTSWFWVKTFNPVTKCVFLRGDYNHTHQLQVNTFVNTFADFYKVYCRCTNPPTSSYKSYLVCANSHINYLTCVGIYVKRVLPVCNNEFISEEGITILKNEDDTFQDDEKIKMVTTPWEKRGQWFEHCVLSRSLNSNRLCNVNVLGTRVRLSQ